MGAETPEQAAYERYRRVVGGLWLTDGNPEMPDSVEALPPVLQRAWEAVAAKEPHAAPDPDGQQRYIDQLHDLIRDMCDAYPGLATELPAFQDRAGQLYVHDHDGQPISGSWADGDGPRPAPAPAPAPAEPKPAPGADADRGRYYEALQRIVDAVGAGDAAAVDKLARNALGWTRVGRPAPFQPEPDLEVAFANGMRVRTGLCAVEAHDREHFQVRTNGHWLCGHLLASVLTAQGIVAGTEAQPANELADALGDWPAILADVTQQRDDLRELLDQVGVLAANAPEDDGSFAVCEQIAMRIAAAGVPDTTPIDEWPAPDREQFIAAAEEHLAARRPRPADTAEQPAPVVAAAMRESRLYREALHRAQEALGEDGTIGRRLSVARSIVKAALEGK